MAKSNMNINISLDGLEQLKKNLMEAKKYHVEVGVLDDARNASIGAVHEFGSKSRNIPRRSFLIDPLRVFNPQSLTLYLKKESENIMKDLLLDKGIRRIYYKVGLRAKAIIDDAFATGGEGHWSELKAATIQRKGNDAILRETEQLRESIKFRTIKGQ
jgi:phage gpG-like protein